MAPPATSALMGSQASLAPSHRWFASTRLMHGATSEHWRRALTSALGAIWLLDALLQFQPYMFTQAFPRQVIASTAAGNPSWVHGPVLWASNLMNDHIVVLNATFAVTQLLIAIGLFWPRTLRVALGGSVVWSLLVWWLGEGLGGILTGPVSPVAGLPGAVLLYAIAAVLLWPRPAQAPTESVTGSVATRSVLRTGGATTVWIVLWFGFAWEAVRPANRAPGALHDMVAGMADGEPAWLGHINARAASLLDGRGLGFSVLLAACFVLIAVSVLVPRLTRAGIVLALVVSLTIWVVFEDFGGIGTGQGTDPNSGLPLALLALCYWPAVRRARVTPPSSGRG